MPPEDQKPRAAPLLPDDAFGRNGLEAHAVLADQPGLDAERTEMGDVLCPGSLYGPQ